MGKYLIALIIVFVGARMIAQNVAINSTGAPAHPSAILDLSSDDKGILIPRMSTAQREAIVSPSTGLMVYDISTRSLWFHDGAWKEITAGGSLGTAGGDLYGQYPDPFVGKIHGHDVSALTPNDKQALKWDAGESMWKGMNDSLYFPFAVETSNSGYLFSLNNTYNGLAPATTIHGQRFAPSGIAQPFNSAIWGDAFTGTGVVGTSSYASGVSGTSVQNHGIEGASQAAGKAGVHGISQSGSGIGVMGEVQSSGIGVVGKAVDGGLAGRFESTSSMHGDTTLSVQTQGLGTLAHFEVASQSNDHPAIDVVHAGEGNAIKLRLNRSDNTANGIDLISQGEGIGIYSKSENGMGGKFENTNATNPSTVLAVSNAGSGAALNINSTSTGATDDVVKVTNQGTGIGLHVQSAKGKAALFEVTDPSATNETMIVQTVANKRNAKFISDHATTIQSNVYVENNGKGRGIEVQMLNSESTNAGLFVNTFGNIGIEVASGGTKGITAYAIAPNAIGITGSTPSSATNGIGVKGITSANGSNCIGVLGEAGVNDPNGIGVKGIAGGGMNGGIGVFGEAKPGNPSAIAVKGVGYSQTETVGAVTGINMVDGVGVFGEALGFDGIGVAGTVGNTGNHSVAAVFTNTYSENNRAVMELITNGKGNGLLIDHNSLTSTAPMIRVTNSSPGQFVRFEDGLGDIKTTISKEGNVVTDGTVTVKSNKGIVRNTSSSQLRVETHTVTIPAGTIGHYDEFNSGIYIDVNFTEAFSSAPAVYIGNYVQGTLIGLTKSIVNVTTTGCTFQAWNYTAIDFNYPATVIKIIAIGAE